MLTLSSYSYFRAKYIPAVSRHVFAIFTTCRVLVFYSDRIIILSSGLDNSSFIENRRAQSFRDYVYAIYTNHTAVVGIARYCHDSCETCPRDGTRTRLRLTGRVCTCTIRALFVFFLPLEIARLWKRVRRHPRRYCCKMNERFVCGCTGNARITCFDRIRAVRNTIRADLDLSRNRRSTVVFANARPVNVSDLCRLEKKFRSVRQRCMT